MKAMRHILIVFAAVWSITLSAEISMPTYQMHSTSSMVYSGSTLPQAAITGVTTSDALLIESARQASAATPNSGPRRVTSSGFEEEDDPDVPINPFPIGDGMWFMVILAVGYSFFIAWKKRRVNSEE